MNNGSVFQQGVSVSVGVACWVAAGVLWFVVKGHTPPKVDAWIDRLIVVLVLTGTVGIAGTGLGGLLRRGVTNVTGLVSNIAGSATGFAAVLAVALVSLVIVVVHVYEASVTKGSLVAAVVAPLTAGSIPGSFGVAALSLITAVSGTVAAGVGGLFGIG